MRHDEACTSAAEREPLTDQVLITLFPWTTAAVISKKASTLKARRKSEQNYRCPSRLKSAMKVLVRRPRARAGPYRLACPRGTATKHNPSAPARSVFYACTAEATKAVTTEDTAVVAPRPKRRYRSTATPQRSRMTSGGVGRYCRSCNPLHLESCEVGRWALHLSNPHMKWEYTQLRFIPRGKSWTGEIEELWLDQRQIIFRSRPRPDITLGGVMNELGDDGWELVTYSQPFTGYHGGCYTFKREKGR